MTKANDFKVLEHEKDRAEGPDRLLVEDNFDTSLAGELGDLLLTIGGSHRSISIPDLEEYGKCRICEADATTGLWHRDPLCEEETLERVCATCWENNTETVENT